MVNLNSVLSSVNFCVICGNPRLDGDSTGVTCGSARCLDELGRNYSEPVDTERLLTSIADEIGMDLEKLPNDLDEVAREICEAIAAIKDAGAEYTPEVQAALKVLLKASRHIRIEG